MESKKSPYSICGELSGYDFPDGKIRFYWEIVEDKEDDEETEDDDVLTFYV